MKLTLQGISERTQWEEKGYQLPQYDINKMKKATKEAPFWIHFGAGNLFRAFHAGVVQNLLNAGVLDRGLVVAEGFDYEIIEKMYTPHDNLGIVATLKSDGTIDKTVVASVAEALPLDSENETAYSRLKEIFTKDSLQMATFTITEKGYSLVNGKGEQLKDVAQDFKNGPQKPEKQKPQNDFVYRDIEEKMNKIMGTKVVIKNREHDKGKIEIEYYSQAELERIYDLLKQIKNE